MPKFTAHQDLLGVRTHIERLKAELAELEEKALKICHYIELVEVYEEKLDAGIEAETRQSRTAPQSLVLGNLERGGVDHDKGIIPIKGDPPKNVRIVIQILRLHGQPLPTKKLVEELDRRGVEIGGSNPITNLSSALSRFKNLLVADRSEGWSLREWFSEPNPSEEPGYNDNPFIPKPETAKDFLRESYQTRLAKDWREAAED